MSKFLAILEYIGIIAILLGSIGLVQEFIEGFKHKYYDYDLTLPIISLIVGIGLVYFC